MSMNRIQYSLRILKLFSQRISIPGGVRFWSTLISLSFIGKTIFSNGDAILNLKIYGFTWVWLLFGFLVSTLSLFVNAIAWKSLLNWLGYRPKELHLIPLFISSNLLKYIPGGIWHFVERLRVLRPYMTMSQALSSVLLEPLLMVAAALLWVPLGGWQSGTSIFCILPALLFLRNLRVPVIRFIESLKAKDLKRIDPSLSFDQESIQVIRAGYPSQALLIEMAFVLIRFLGFWCYLNAFAINSSLEFFQWLAAFSLAWTIGLVVPAAPGGLGIFEATLLVRVGLSVPEAPLIASLLCYRVAATSADLLAATCVSKYRPFE